MRRPSGCRLAAAAEPAEGAGQRRRPRPMNAAPMNTGPMSAVPMNTGPMSAVPMTTGPGSTGPGTGGSGRGLTRGRAVRPPRPGR